MFSLLRHAKRFLPSKRLAPLKFPQKGFRIYTEWDYVEEELMDMGLRIEDYYPGVIGEIVASKYQIVGKLGCGRSSTVWLARNLSENYEYVALKIFARDMVESFEKEFALHKEIANGNREHPRYDFLRDVIKSISIPSPKGEHKCLVQRPIWDTGYGFKARNRWFPEEVFKSTLAQVLLGLDYLHTECKLVHTDNSILDRFVIAELNDPSPRKFLNNRIVYQSRIFDETYKYDKVVLGDFGTVQPEQPEQKFYVQPDFYRSPEVMLEAGWSYPIDIWALGCLVPEMLFDRRFLTGKDPKELLYRTRAHIAQIAALLGMPPLDVVKKGKRSKEFFDEDGKWVARIPIPELEFGMKDFGEQYRASFGVRRGMISWILWGEC